MKENGVWRTVGGRRIFIKEGQDLASAMKESGKFSTKQIENQKDKIRSLNEKIKELNGQIYGKTDISEEEKNKMREEVKKLKEEKKKISEQEEENIRLKSTNDDKEITKELLLKTDDKIKSELKNDLQNIEKYEDDYGIKSNIVDDTYTETYKKVEKMYEDGEINEYVYENFINEYSKKVSDEMSEKGYELYLHNGEQYYSQLPKAKKAYNDIISELDKKQIKYKISRSWNKGELPSIYVENNNGEVFRIANHFNSKNQQFEAYSLNENKIYSTKDYINYKETVIKDLEKWLKENE